MTDRIDELGELVRHVSRALRRRTFAVVEPYGLSVHQFRALRMIAGRGPHAATGPVRISDIAGRMRIVARSATDVVDLLEQKDLARRAPHPTDRRSTVVELTARGSATLDEVEVQRAAQEEEFFARLSGAERRELVRLLRELDA